MYKNGLVGIAALLLMSSAYAQYDVKAFGLELQALKARIDQKKMLAPAVPPGTIAPAVAPDTISADQSAELSKQIDACQKTMDGMASTAQARMKRSESWAISGAVTGLLGSVAAGHISTVVVGLLSGTAGLANTVQQIYKDQGDTPEAVLATRSGIRKQAVAAIDEYTKATDDEGRYNAMVKLHFSCAMYELTSEEKLPSPTTK